MNYQKIIAFYLSVFGLQDKLKFLKIEDSGHYPEAKEVFVFAKEETDLDEDNFDYLLYEDKGKYKVVYWVTHGATKWHSAEDEDKEADLGVDNFPNALRALFLWMIDDRIAGFLNHLAEKKAEV